MKSSDDIFVWPDDTTCTREEHDQGEMSHKSDDYLIVRVGTRTWELAHSEHQEGSLYDYIVDARLNDDRHND